MSKNKLSLKLRSKSTNNVASRSSYEISHYFQKPKLPKRSSSDTEEETPIKPLRLQPTISMSNIETVSISKPNLSDTATDLNDFDTPKVRKIPVIFQPNYKPDLNSKKARRKNLTEQQKKFLYADLERQNIELALALSKSISDQESPSTNQNLSQGTTQKRIRTTLAQYGFKNGQNSEKQNYRSNQISKSRKKGKRLLKTTLLRRTNIDREKIIQDKISKILFAESQNPKSDLSKSYYDSFHVRLFGETLESNYCHERVLFAKASLNVDISVDPEYFYTNLVSKSSVQSGYLLKDWNKIPGRELSPLRNTKFTLFPEATCSTSLTKENESILDYSVNASSKEKVIYPFSKLTSEKSTFAIVQTAKSSKFPKEFIDESIILTTKFNIESPPHSKNPHSELSPEKSKSLQTNMDGSLHNFEVPSTQLNSVLQKSLTYPEEILMESLNNTVRSLTPELFSDGDEQLEESKMRKSKLFEEVFDLTQSSEESGRKSVSKLSNKSLDSNDSTELPKFSIYYTLTTPTSNSSRQLHSDNILKNIFNSDSSNIFETPRTKRSKSPSEKRPEIRSLDRCLSPLDLFDLTEDDICSKFPISQKTLNHLQSPKTDSFTNFNIRKSKSFSNTTSPIKSQTLKKYRSFIDKSVDLCAKNIPNMGTSLSQTESEDESVIVISDEELNYSCSTPYKKPQNLEILDHNGENIQNVSLKRPTNSDCSTLISRKSVKIPNISLFSNDTDSDNVEETPKTPLKQNTNSISSNNSTSSRIGAPNTSPYLTGSFIDNADKGAIQKTFLNRSSHSDISQQSNASRKVVKTLNSMPNLNGSFTDSDKRDETPKTSFKQSAISGNIISSKFSGKSIKTLNTMSYFNLSFISSDNGEETPKTMWKESHRIFSNEIISEAGNRSAGIYDSFQFEKVQKEADDCEVENDEETLKTDVNDSKRNKKTRDLSVLVNSSIELSPVVLHLSDKITTTLPQENDSKCSELSIESAKNVSPNQASNYFTNSNERFEVSNKIFESNQNMEVDLTRETHSNDIFVAENNTDIDVSKMYETYKANEIYDNFYMEIDNNCIDTPTFRSSLREYPKSPNSEDSLKSRATKEVLDSCDNDSTSNKIRKSSTSNDHNASLFADSFDLQLKSRLWDRLHPKPRTDNNCSENDTANQTQRKSSILPYFETPTTEVIIKEHDVTPYPEYEQMNTPQRNKELQKFGLKPMKRLRANQLLRYIYEQTHPLVKEKTVEIDSDENEENIQKRQKKSDIIENREDSLSPEESVQIVGDLLSDNDIETDLIFERRLSKKVASCRLPFHIAWHNYVSCNPELCLKILKYEPLQLESICLHFKRIGYRFHIDDVLSFLDKRCITIRTNQNNNRNKK